MHTLSIIKTNHFIAFPIQSQSVGYPIPTVRILFALMMENLFPAWQRKLASLCIIVNHGDCVVVMTLWTS